MQLQRTADKYVPRPRYNALEWSVVLGCIAAVIYFIRQYCMGGGYGGF